MSVKDTVAALLSEVQKIAKSDTVFGEPIVAGDTTLIPVSKISVGLAAGGSGKGEGSSGIGGGVQVTPIALVSVTNGKVSVHTMDNGNTDIARIINLAPDLIEAITKKLKK